MKKIIVKKYDEEWGESGLDYDKELKRLKNEDIYLAFRNSRSSINSYAIIDLKSEGDGIYTSCEFQIKGFEHWDRNIFQFCHYFEKQFTTKPHILIANINTLNKIDSITGAGGAMRVFKCNDFELKICIDMNLPDDKFKIIYDESAEFQEQEQEGTKEAHKRRFKNIFEHETLIRIQRIIHSLEDKNEKQIIKVLQENIQFIKNLNQEELSCFLDTIESSFPLNEGSSSLAFIIGKRFIQDIAEESKVTIKTVFNELTKAKNSWTLLFKEKSIHDNQDLCAYFEEIANSLFFLHLKISTVYSAAFSPELEQNAVEKWEELLFPSFVIVNEFFENFDPGKYSSNEDYAYLFTKDSSFLDTLQSLLILYYITNSINIEFEQL